MMKKKTVQKEEDSSAGVGMAGWEVRPCGMLVQKRDPDSDPHPHPSSLPPLIRVKVSYGRSTHHVSISAHASFGMIIASESLSLSLCLFLFDFLSFVYSKIELFSDPTER